MTDEYFNVLTDGSKGTGPAVAKVLRTAAEILEDAPEGYRYDFELRISEHAGGDDD